MTAIRHLAQPPYVSDLRSTDAKYNPESHALAPISVHNCMYGFPRFVDNRLMNEPKDADPAITELLDRLNSEHADEPTPQGETNSAVAKQNRFVEAVIAAMRKKKVSQD
jgi:hypothetical protein